ncbi:related to IKI3 - Subunit of RNA polymerase II elongator histone acetyltransferase complex [Moesziomyces antarcticus]|uniref:Related to IKI3 - Subunit of RNA polymerase II elongator histone acetyltransferase complex n=2 Tax=Pseudozyma antarctica TaxID=84753 RepID=A0A5C3FH01_PSEA2|nr:related to IKI3 - Subunit of RNA polymerase II elongator histone acetyltransferase complex [Moesziomyces antarcticus]
MRNLCVLSHRAIALSQASQSALRIEATASDLDDGSVYAVATSRTASGAPDVTLSFLRSAVDGQGLERVSSLLVPGRLADLPDSAGSIASTSGRSKRDVINLHYLSDGGAEASHRPALCTIAAGGDLLLLPIPDISEVADDVPPEEPVVVGTIEQGIAAAAWSPDDELLVIVTCETSETASTSGAREVEKVLLMMRDFEVLSEVRLRTDEFGQDEAVDVGWGSKATQFHGSEGKAAAAAAAQAAAAAKASNTDTRGPSTSDDDGAPRISWRGDGAFFAISSLEPFYSPDAPTSWHRVIRIYSRTGALSATSDAGVRGISQALAFRPIGNLIASTQRFGPSDLDGHMWAQGRKGRHDVVFFERNGLRHGEFSLREEAASQPDGVQLGWNEAQKHSAWTRTHAVRELAWNADGSALAVWLSRTGEQHEARDVVQVYTTGNYHWYLKQEFVAATGVEHVKWHPEDPLQLLVAHADRVEHRVFAHETVVSPGRPPVDAACVAVADGSAALLTPFRMQNVPPPMASLSLCVPPAGAEVKPSAVSALAVPTHVAWSQLPGSSPQHAVGVMALLFQNGWVQVWRFDWGVLGGTVKVGGKPVAEPTLVATAQVAASDAHQIAVAGWAPTALDATHQCRISVAVLSSHHQGAVAECIDLTQAREAATFEATVHAGVRLPGHGKRRVVADPFVPTSQVPPGFYVQESDGTVQRVRDSALERVTKLERFCADVRVLVAADGTRKVVGLASDGRLLAESQAVAKDATSFTLVGSFLVWTNTAHEARFLPLGSLRWSSTDEVQASASEAVDLGRRVERGSRIVTAVASAMSLVLQMPRGNLETIYPRPLVLEVVRRSIDAHRYGAAFRICRTHRLDVNILYDHDPAGFMANVATFVQQVADVDHLNLFLSGLRDHDVTKTLYKPLASSTGAGEVAGKVNRICDAIRTELERLDARKYVQSILTTHVRKVPADYEAGLALLLQLKDEDAETAEEAVKYIIFLADADKLFDVALGMYDFTLTLMVAQHAKRKDPREYLPFLRELRALEPQEFQRFRIDDHLARHTKALGWLVRAGPQHHPQALEYIDKHKLYHDAIALLAGQGAKLRDVYDRFGDYLLTRRKLDDAGAAFQLAGRGGKALDAYRECANWQEAMRLAFVEKLPASEIVAMAKGFVSELETLRRFTEAARVCLDYVRDVEQGVALLCRAGEFSEARRVLTTYSRLDLVEVTLHPGLLEAATTLVDDVQDMESQLSKQLDRIRELRDKRAAHPDGALYDGDNDPALDNLDIMSDTSTQMTQFTRYTRAASIVSQSSMATFSTKSGSRKKEAKLRKKAERQKAGGKKGTVFEEDYLYTSVQKLIKERLGSVQAEAAKLLPHLVCAASGQVRARAGEVVQALDALERNAHKAVDTLWAYSQQDDDERFDQLVRFEQELLGGQVAANPAMAAVAFRSIANRRIPRPKLDVADTKWRPSLLDSSQP